MSWLDKAFGIYPTALSFHSQRSTVLAANIANSDTPNYKAKDFNFKDALNMHTTGRVLTMKTTNGNHTQSAVSESFGGLLYRVPTKQIGNGNTVESEIEQAAFAENALRYQTSLEFLNGAINGLRLAIKGQ